MRIRTILITAVLVLTSAGTLSACSGSSAGTTGGKPSVVASFYPLFEAARRVGTGRVSVANLTPAGAEPHDLELSPKQVDELLDATVLLYLGHGFQPAVEDVARSRHAGVTVDILSQLAALHRVRTLPGDAKEKGTDPHVWQDPALMAEVIDQVKGALIRADPGGTSTYERNAERYRSEIEALDRRFREGLRDCARRLIVTSHAAFGYLAARYGLTQESIAGLSPEAEPDPQRIAEIADLVRREGVTTIFMEELVSPRVAQTLGREAGVRTATLNPLEGLTSREMARGETYVSVMDGNLSALRSALGCR